MKMVLSYLMWHFPIRTQMYHQTSKSLLQVCYPQCCQGDGDGCIHCCQHRAPFWAGFRLAMVGMVMKMALRIVRGMVMGTASVMVMVMVLI